MKKKRIRYSELAPQEPLAPAAPTPRPRRDSTPVELARALAAARSAELAVQAVESTRASNVEVAPRRSGPVPRASQPVELDGSLRARARSRVGVAELLMFRIGTERFAVELCVVEEVIDLPTIHHVPEMPPAMLGVVAVREQLTPVYSPHHVLGSPLASREALLIFRQGATRSGLLIDDVDDAIVADLRELRDAPGADENDAVVLGVIRHEDVLVAVLDADALIAACQSAVLLETA